MLQVWVDAKKAGILDRLARNGSSFAYAPTALPEQEVSLTLPVRVPSYDIPFGLTPIFEMNLPEGALRESLRLRFAKALGSFDDFDLLSVVGRSQIGRIGFSGVDETLDSDVPFQSIDEILRARRAGGLFDYLVETFAAHSGVAGVQPKVLIRGDDTRSIRTATHIVKFASPEYPELAANEFFCLEAARRLGLDVPNFALSDSGDALVVERFDLLPEGHPLGFEDFCVLNGLGTENKYRGSYETALFKRLKEFVSPAERIGSLKRAFALFVLNAGVRNGDAHLKNWGVVYDDPNEKVTLAPVFDVVTTTAYVPGDRMALVLEANPAWPDAKKIEKLGRTRAELSGPVVREIIQNAADVMAELVPEINSYFRESPHPEVGDRMVAAWQEGLAHSLSIAAPLPSPASEPDEPNSAAPAL